MKRIAFACLGVVGLMFAGTAVANAGGVHVQIGGHGGGWYGGHGFHRGYAPYRGYQYRSPKIWHDTSHYHYNPGVYVPHGNHYHYIPGHYELHRDGHFDTWHGDHVHHGH